MGQRRFLTLLGAAALVLVLALWLNLRRNATADFHESALFPTLAGELDSVTGIDIRKGGAAPNVSVRKTGSQWTVAQRADYPADLTKVRKLLIALGDAKVVEEKTANPAEFPIIGVEDPGAGGASGSEISVSARDGRHAVIIGKASGSGEFARRANENQSVVIQPSISVETEPRYWIDPHLIDIPVADVQRIEVRIAAAPPYVVKRLKPKEEDFALEGVPAGRKAADARTLAPSPSLGGALNADDVAPAGEIDFGKPSEATLTLSNERTVKLLGTVIGDKHWIRILSGADPKREGRFADRAFEIPSYRYDAIFRPVEQLLVPKPAPAAKSGQATGKDAAQSKATGSAHPKSTGAAQSKATGTAQTPSP
jgi:hypothetical protein